MTEFKTVFLDTAPIIYFLDKDKNFGDKAKAVIETFINSGKAISTSAVTFEEYLVHPYMTGDIAKKQMLDKFVKVCGINVISVDEVIADKAAQIRAVYKDLKSMDALQLAAAAMNSCDVFFTNDKQLKQFKEITVLTLDDFEI